MELKLIRKYRKTDYTIGILYINNEYFCEILEDIDRGLKDSMSLEEIKKIKIKDQTCIPYGKYQILMTYSPKYKKIMPLINNVKGFEGIRIHSGNTNKDTSGCLLPGFNKIKGQVINSRETFNKLYSLIQTAINNKENVTIEITK